MTPAILLDRDGTVTEEVGPVLEPGQLRLLPGSAAAIRDASEAGFKVVLATNQSAVARGLLCEDGLAAVHRRLSVLLSDQGARLDGIYHCPHHPDHGGPLDGRRCGCRKPEPGLLQRAAADLGLDLFRSYSVGDRLRDVQAGRAAGTRTILVLTGYGREEFEYGSGHEFGYDAGRGQSLADHVAADLFDAVQWILRRERDVNRPDLQGRPAP